MILEILFIYLLGSLSIYKYAIRTIYYVVLLELPSWTFGFVEFLGNLGYYGLMAKHVYYVGLLWLFHIVLDRIWINLSSLGYYFLIF